MATSVKVRETDKARLDRLQAEVTARSGEKISQQDLVAGLLDLAERRIDEIAPKRRRASLKRLMSLPVDVGVTRSEDIDRILYGEES